MSCAIYLCGRDTAFTAFKFTMYCVVQVVAGIVAALLGAGVFGHHVDFGVKPPYHTSQALVGELIFTFILSRCKQNGGEMLRKAFRSCQKAKAFGGSKLPPTSFP